MVSLLKPLRVLLPALLLLAGPSVAAELPVPKGPVLVTVSGHLTYSNRGAFDPARDLLFKFHEIGFDKAVVFDRATLAALPQTQLLADFPKGAKPRGFAGPRLSAVLKAAGATGDIVILRAFDGYKVEIPRREIDQANVILALSEAGRPLDLGGPGPLWLIWPRLQDATLKEMPDDRWIWGVFHIESR